MASVVVTLRIMPENPQTDLAGIESKAKKEIFDFCRPAELKTNVEPIAFGLKALNILFLMEEDKGSTEELEKSISRIEGVESVEVTDVRRAIE